MSGDRAECDGAEGSGTARGGAAGGNVVRVKVLLFASAREAAGGADELQISFDSVRCEA